MTQHPNSKKITIFRHRSFLAAGQSTDVDAFFNDSKQSIGSYFASRTSQEIGSGLTKGEKDILLPTIVAMPSDDREFRKAVNEFYQDIDSKIDYRTGLELEVGLEEDNDKPVSDKNFPLKLMDYIRYRHALDHPEVSLTKEAGEGNLMKKYYIFDKETVVNKNSKRNKVKDAAQAVFLKIKDVPETVDQMLTLLGVNIREYASLKPDQRTEAKQSKLREIAESKEIETIEKFIATHQDENLELKHWIKRMVQAGTLTQYGSKYSETETKQLMASSLDELVAMLLDEDNSGLLSSWKARTQMNEDIPVEANKRKTVLTQ